MTNKKFESKLSEIFEVVESADELLDMCAMVDVGQAFAKMIVDHLSSCECSETEKDFDTAYGLVKETIMLLMSRALSSKEDGIGDVIDAIKGFRLAMTEFEKSVREA